MVSSMEMLTPFLRMLVPQPPPGEQVLVITLRGQVCDWVHWLFGLLWGIHLGQNCPKLDMKPHSPLYLPQRCIQDQLGLLLSPAIPTGGTESCHLARESDGGVCRDLLPTDTT